MSTQSAPLSVIENVYLRLFHVEWYPLLPQQWQLRDMQSSFWRFYMNDRDGATIASDAGILTLKARQLYFIPAGVRFSADSAHKLHQFYVHFDVIGLPAFVARELFASPISLPPLPPLQRRVLAVARQLEEGKPLYLTMHLQIKAVLYEGLARYLQTLPPQHIEHYQNMMQELAPVLPAIHHIEQNLTAPLSNRDLAHCCHMSESYFIRRFHECVQQTPKQYLMERRVQIAAQQLLFSDRSIDHIATETGFGNRFYFSRIFTRKTGVSPAAYRKTSRV